MGGSEGRLKTGPTSRLKTGPTARLETDPTGQPYHRFMPTARAIPGISRRDPGVRRIALAWRRLTGGTSRSIPETDRRTLVACSGGADSSALVLALAAVTGELVVGHVVHDLRPRDEAGGDRDAALALAGRLGLPFDEAEICARTLPGNTEANARRLRYTALEDLALRHGCAFIATAHHGDDQVETVLMALLRGAGPLGLGGIRPSRRLSDKLTLIRPALALDRDECRRLCVAAGCAWREDLTNLDTSRLRAAIRSEIIPALKRLRPGLIRRVGDSATLLRDAAGLIDERAAALVEAARQLDDSILWPRGALRGQPDAVLGQAIRRAAGQLEGGRGADALGSAALGPLLRAIREWDAEPRLFELSGIRAVVSVDRVSLERTGNG
jgi:tRNA(Ile)-lysidine synthase